MICISLSSRVRVADLCFLVITCLCCWLSVCLSSQVYGVDVCFPVIVNLSVFVDLSLCCWFVFPCHCEIVLVTCVPCHREFVLVTCVFLSLWVYIVDLCFQMTTNLCSWFLFSCHREFKLLMYVSLLSLACVVDLCYSVAVNSCYWLMLPSHRKCILCLAFDTAVLVGLVWFTNCGLHCIQIRVPIDPAWWNSDQCTNTL